MGILITGFNKDIDNAPSWFTKRSLAEYWKRINSMSGNEYRQKLCHEPGFKKTLDTLEKRGQVQDRSGFELT